MRVRIIAYLRRWHRTLFLSDSIENVRTSLDYYTIENGGHHLAAVPFYFLLVVGHTLSGRQHIVNDNDFFSLYITGNLVIPLKDTAVRSVRFM